MKKVTNFIKVVKSDMKGRKFVTTVPKFGSLELHAVLDEPVY